MKCCKDFNISKDTVFWKLIVIIIKKSSNYLIRNKKRNYYKIGNPLKGIVLFSFTFWNRVGIAFKNIECIIHHYINNFFHGWNILSPFPGNYKPENYENKKNKPGPCCIIVNCKCFFKSK